MKNSINLKNAKVLSRNDLKLISGGIGDSTLPVQPSLISGPIGKCISKYKCFDKPTEAGVALCVGDCVTDPNG
ncbi:hypothetical protein [Elizabethkingia meningoseptica]|uniref:hypothetical protein n=1 Tax=Elizabethkingia meningoseptica TaxID=238 RepID=UPI0020133657|nr:hypothetical protein [Elizabethkingia meningoseptica]MCL1675611.1 hypothetical protein [Elizabethkingia meningoseptica]MCL1686973.1 hypothetical protein [Elizabethkingia meningoseptica]